MAIYVTGDIHACPERLNSKNFPQGKELTKKDYVIICGDFGLVWDFKGENGSEKFWLNWLEEKPWTTLFIDGNHENFDILNSYPVTKWNGGNVHIIRKNIIHLMRGQVFNIEGKSIFTFGGGTSIDKYRREEHISWWKEEIPSKEEINEGIINLSKYDNKVDFIITHSCDSKVLNNPVLFFRGNKCEAYEDNYVLDNFENIVTYKKWFFGHYHVDAVISDNKVAVYNDIRELD